MTRRSPRLCKNGDETSHRLVQQLLTAHFSHIPYHPVSLPFEFHTEIATEFFSGVQLNAAGVGVFF